MAVLVWDQIGERLYETGVDHGVLYVPDVAGVYNTGFSWNGLSSITETPTGAEANAIYADNIKYLNLVSVEEFTATLEAFTYPDEFAQFDGQVEPEPGVVLGQQNRGTFGLSYRTRIGNDLEGDAHGYKLHLVYGLLATPSERQYSTVNDSPEPAAFSWELSSTPAPVTGHKPVSLITINSLTADPTDLAALEVLLYGAVATAPALPTPDAILTLFA